MADVRRRKDNGVWDAERTDLLSMLSHELRTPLTMVLSASRVLARHPGVRGNEELQALSVDLIQSGRRLERVLENALLLAHLNDGERPTLEPILVRASIVNAIKDHERDFPNGKVEVAGSPRDLAVEGDAAFFRLILLNLLRNGEEHSKEGEPTLLSWEAADGLGLIYVCTEDRYDTPADHDTWFEPFYRSDRATVASPGAGLGLTVARGLARSMGGDLLAEPWSHKPGTRMVLSLPLLRQPS